MTIMPAFTLLGAIIQFLSASDLLPLLLWCIPLAIAVAAYRLLLAGKWSIPSDIACAWQQQLQVNLSLKRSDLQCQERWLTQYAGSPVANADRLRHIERLKSEIALLEKELAALKAA